MTLYRNLTGETSRVGLIVKQAPNDPNAFVYATSIDTNILGVITKSVPKYAKCEIQKVGKAKVMVSDATVQGSIIRLQKSSDNISRATCKTAKSSDAPYLKIGTALQSGKGLIDVSLDINYIISSSTTTEFLKVDQTTQQTTTGTLHFPTATFGGTTNYSQFEADGTYVMNGNATVWDDLRIVPGAFDYAGTGDPVLIDYQPGGSGTTFKVYSFQASQQAFFTVQIPHNYKEGSSIYCHTHWTPGTRGNEEDGKTVAWKLDYSWASINGNFGASTTADMTDTCDGTDHKHQMSPDIEIVGTGKGISSMLICRVFRDAGDSWVGTTAAQSPIFLEIDFHYMLDTVGSRAQSSK